MTEFKLSSDNFDEAMEHFVRILRDAIERAPPGAIHIHVYVHNEKGEREWQELRGNAGQIES